MNEEKEREVFEERVFSQYFISTIQKNPDPRPRIAGCLDLIPVNCKTKEEFIKRNEDGYYVEPTLNAAWWAWLERSKL